MQSDPYAACLRPLRGAVLLLVGPGPMKQRLCEAALRHLQELDASELPKDVTSTWLDLMGSLQTAQAAGGLSSMEATVRKMSEFEAAACAMRVLELYVTLAGRDARAATAGGPRQLRLVGDD
jgi:hypothetical protein